MSLNAYLMLSHIFHGVRHVRVIPWREGHELSVIWFDSGGSIKAVGDTEETRLTNTMQGYVAQTSAHALESIQPETQGPTPLC